MKIREKAWNLLCAICLDKQYSNLLLRHELDAFSSLDRAWITQVVYGTLQNYRLLRYQWEHLVKKIPDDKLCVLLDMSVYQIFFMDKVPMYAIVNEAVEISKKYHTGYGKLVNGILHNVIRQGKRKLVGTEDEILAIETSHPLWLIHMWNAQYGKEICRNICFHDMQTHLPCARVNTLRVSKDQLQQQETLFTNGLLCEDALRYTGGSLAATSYYQQGLIAIQDEASQMVAVVLDPQPHERILDVCSAPGTKTTHIAQRMQNEGEIIAGDIHAHRIRLVKEGAKRLGVSIVDARVMDAVMLPGLQSHSFDRVLCDVPCSGYGVLQRKSDIKYHMQSSDMDTLIPLQQKILHKAAEMVKEHGILVYSTCTLNKKENEKQIETFLKSHTDYKVIEQRTIFPYEYDCDGFYIAKLKRCMEKR